MTTETVLMWIDCEMTGLIPHKDCLAEVAVIPTDTQLNVLDEGIDIVIRPPDSAMEHMGDFVRNMHTKSGLLREIPNGVTVGEAEREVLAYIKRFAPEPKRALLAGNSVGTDKLFMEIEMPQVIDHLHYRLIDVSSIKQLAKYWIKRAYIHQPLKEGDHRALADIRESIRELRYYRTILFPQGAGPSSPECVEAADLVSGFDIDIDDGWADLVAERFAGADTDDTNEE